MKKNIIKAFAGDLMYSIIALMAFNGAMQLVVYPYMTKKMGAGPWGDVLTIISIVAIVACSFGSGANYSHMVVSTRHKGVSGDYNIFLAFTALLSLPVSFAAMFVIKNVSVGTFVGIFLLMVMTTLRYYGDVDFRLRVNYKEYMFYYFVITAGYVLGALSYSCTGSWAFTLILGESVATIFLLFKGQIYKRPLFKRSEWFKENILSMLTLSGAYLVANLVLNSDRILLNIFVSSEAVTVFYTATLIGKIVALLTSPLNGVITGHLAKYEGNLTKKAVSIMTAVLLGVMAVVCAGSTIVSYLFVMVMYPDLLEAAKPLFIVANAGQILYFVSETFMVILLRFAEENMQLRINGVYAVLFYVCAIPSVILFKTMGLAWAVLAANALRFIIVVAVAFRTASRGGEAVSQENS